MVSSGLAAGAGGSSAGDQDIGTSAAPINGELKR